MMDHINGALPWVSLAVALAIILTYSDLARKHNQEKNNEE